MISQYQRPNRHADDILEYAYLAQRRENEHNTKISG